MTQQFSIKPLKRLRLKFTIITHGLNRGLKKSFLTFTQTQRNMNRKSSIRGFFILCIHI